jgi:hypothetical protein
MHGVVTSCSHVRRRSHLPAALVLLAALVIAGACRSAAPGDGQAPPPKTVPSAPTAESHAEAFENTIKWSTASELDNFGYAVYRSESEDGPFARINTEVIEGAGTTDEVSHYCFVDDTIDPHKTYYYYVESISMSGVRERFTPIAETPPKIPPADSEENDGH